LSLYGIREKKEKIGNCAVVTGGKERAFTNILSTSDSLVFVRIEGKKKKKNKTSSMREEKREKQRRKIARRRLGRERTTLRKRGGP